MNQFCEPRDDCAFGSDTGKCVFCNREMGKDWETVSETSQEELVHDHLCDLAKPRMEALESDLKDLREECEVVYVETGSLRAKVIAKVLLELESLK